MKFGNNSGKELIQMKDLINSLLKEKTEKENEIMDQRENIDKLVKEINSLKDLQLNNELSKTNTVEALLIDDNIEKSFKQYKISNDELNLLLGDKEEQISEFLKKNRRTKI